MNDQAEAQSLWEFHWWPLVCLTVGAELTPVVRHPRLRDHLRDRPVTELPDIEQITNPD